MPAYFKYFVVACLSVALSITAHAQADLVTAINQQIIPLKTLSPDAGLDDLQKLKPILQGKQIIGIGEATHGTHEFFLFKHRMLEFLVKEIGVKTFVIEGDFAGTQAMNDYVVNGKGDANKGIAGIGFGIWSTQEFVDMANWIKAFNDTQSPPNKVRFFGCDMQWGSSAIRYIKDYLTSLNKFTPEMNAGYEAMKKYTPSLTGKEKAALRKTVASLADIEFTGVDTALYHHYVRELQQFAGNMDAQSTFFPAKQSDWRDKCMAENIEWIYNYTHQNKMMIWAHNGHINKTAGSDGYVRMGSWLARHLQDKYYAMGFDFANGSMRTFDMKQRKNISASLPAAKEGSSGYLFAQCSTPDFILDVKSASANPTVGAFLNTNITSVFYGAVYNGESPHYVTHKLADTYDAIIFIKDTHASTDVSR